MENRANTALEQQVAPYLESFRAFERGLNGESASPIHALRKEAMAHFASTGFPTMRDEEWRFTNIAPIAQASFAAHAGSGATSGEVGTATFAGLESNRIVFVDGVFSPEHSTVR